MTTAAPEVATSESALDPHAPKLSPDDPRLSVGRPRGRTLRAGPIAALLASLLGAGVLAITLAFHPPQNKTQAGAEPSAGPPPPVVPDTIKNARAAPASRARAVRRGARGARASSLRTRTIPSSAPSVTPLAKPAVRGSSSSRLPLPKRSAPRRSRPCGARSPRPDPVRRPRRAGPPIRTFRNTRTPFSVERAASPRPTTSKGRSQPPRSPYEIKAGTVLPAVLITAINSDLPGPVIAQVREHVYDTVTGDYLLVPQGSRLIAQYDSMVAWGQERVLVCWNRLILPNGDSIDLQCMPAADLQGAAGLADEVDEHWWRILKGAAVATLLSAGTAYVAGDTTSYNPTRRSGHGAERRGGNRPGGRADHAQQPQHPADHHRPSGLLGQRHRHQGHGSCRPYPDPPRALGLAP